MKIHIVLDNIRSVFNVGSIFRSADGAGYIEKIYLCGITSDIDNPKLEKTALGATEMVASEHYECTEDALEEIKAMNIPIYFVEIGKKAKNFQETNYPKEIAIVFGHEKEGISKKIVEKYSTEQIMIPMRGMKESLNVANCATAILYEITRGLK